MALNLFSKGYFSDAFPHFFATLHPSTYLVLFLRFRERYEHFDRIYHHVSKLE